VLAPAFLHFRRADGMVRYSIESDDGGGYRALIMVDTDGVQFASGLRSREEAKLWVSARLHSLEVGETPEEAPTTASLGGN
jgi:hypothetical protein